MQVLQGMKEGERAGLDPIKLRRKARDFALKTVKAQRAQFQRYMPQNFVKQKGHFDVSSCLQWYSLAITSVESFGGEE